MKIFGLALALIVAFCPVGAEVLTGHVVGVTDGDTITVLDAAKVQHKIRVAGIDAPEKKAGIRSGVEGKPVAAGIR